MQLGGGALMSIGHGQGENKTQDAIEQALYHPLLESVALDRAAGIIANFTGGPDLTLFEVDAALTRLHDLAGPSTEIVMGVMHDDRMGDRTQVILIITGLGASTLEEAMSQVSIPPVQLKQPPAPPALNRSPEPPPVSRPTLPIREVEPPPPAHPLPAPMRSTLSPAGNLNDLDLPAFMRRRARPTG
jgi:cell division protein FtsZ